VWSFHTEHNRPQFDGLAGTAQPQSTAVMVGGAAELAVAAVSYTPSDITYQWYKDGAAIEGATDATIGTASATLDEEGVYTCVATNEYGSTESAPAMVDVQTGLIHRYTFNDGDVAEIDGQLMALDVVGGADGIIINDTGAAVVADGLLTLGNDGSQSSGGAGADASNGDYVDLPNGLISSLGALTIEAWCTWNDDTAGLWQRVFSFGISNAGEDKSNGANSVMYVTANSNSGDLWAEYLPHQASLNPGTGAMPLHQEVLITLVHDDLGKLDKLFINGIAQAVKKTNMLLSEVNDKNNWLGRSQWNDEMFVGSYDEFRIHDTALSAEEVLANYLAGPDALGVYEAGPCEQRIVGDVNGDCVVDFADAAVLIENFLLDELNK